MMIMAERFFLPDEFPGKFREEMVLAAEIYHRIQGSSFKEYAYAVFDAYFISDSEQKLAALGNFFTEFYEANVTGIQPKNDGQWELTAAFPQFPLDEHNLLCWAADLLLKGYEFDCKLDGYGTYANAENNEFPDEAPARLPWYFDEALKAYNNRNFSTSAIYFSSAIRIFPENANAWYSRGTAKDAIFLRARAREDYDKAISLSPSFVEAYINRGVNKDLAGAYEAALEDFRKALELDGDNAMAYFNMGNTRHNMGNTHAACEDWRKASALGAAYADEQLRRHCK
jgi:tetratricopeptide (TPR) repeat protein